VISVPADFVGPTPAWVRFDVFKPEQARLWSMRRSKRFNVVEAPRRSGKTRLAIYSGVLDWIEGAKYHRDYRVVFGGPTSDHARDLFWDLLLSHVPPRLIRRVNESRMEIRGVHGPLLKCTGMDQARRIEGTPLDRGYFDEMAEMKRGTFRRHIRPSLSTKGREGGAWFFGVPRIGHVRGGGLEFKDLSDLAKDPKHSAEFAYHRWDATGILSDAELASARDSMDEITFAQEYEAKRTGVAGLAYKSFSRELHARADEALPYNPRAPLIFAFDFNVDPGVAVVLQEHRFRELPGRPRADRPDVADEVTVAIGEVHIRHDSWTGSVCKKLIADWGAHEGEILCYGDPAGGSRATNAQESQTDWKIIREMLSLHFGAKRVSIRGPGTEIHVRPRINAILFALRSAAGKIRLLIDPARCPRLIEDLENVSIIPGTDGELNKGRDLPYTHLTDALGYFLVRAHPPGGDRTVSTVVRGWGY